MQYAVDALDVSHILLNSLLMFNIHSDVTGEINQ